MKWNPGLNADALNGSVVGNMTSYAYASSDVYWGQLAGCLEAINCGTTLVVDHAHIVYTPEHGMGYCPSFLPSSFPCCSLPRLFSDCVGFG